MTDAPYAELIATLRLEGEESDIFLATRALLTEAADAIVRFISEE